MLFVTRVLLEYFCRQITNRNAILIFTWIITHKVSFLLTRTWTCPCKYPHLDFHEWFIFKHRPGEEHGVSLLLPLGKVVGREAGRLLHRRESPASEQDQGTESEVHPRNVSYVKKSVSSLGEQGFVPECTRLLFERFLPPLSLVLAAIAEWSVCLALSRDYWT